MKHVKLSKELTLGQKILILGFVLMSNISVIFISVPDVHAEDANVAEGRPGNISIRRGDVEINIDGDETETSNNDVAGSCERFEKDFSEKLRSMVSACSSTNLGSNCLQAVFQCNENSDSDNCEGFSSLTSSMGREVEKEKLEDQKEELEALEKNKKDILNRQTDSQEEIDKLNEKMEDKIREIDSKNEELKHNLAAIKNDTGSKLAVIQTKIAALEEQNNGLIGKLAEQKTQMIQFMTAERLTCNQKSQEHAQSFYTRVSACMEGRGDCGLSLNDFIRNGGRSLAEMAQSYGRTKRRKCLRTDGSGDFAVKYRSMTALIKNNEGQVVNQQNAILKAKQGLINQIQIAKAEGQIGNAQANLNMAEQSRTLTREKQRLSFQLTAKNQILKNQIFEIKKIDDQIEAKNRDITNTRRSVRSSRASGSLNKLRESQLLSAGLIHEAEMAKENGCECSGAIQTISDRSGSGFCESGSSVNTTEDEIELEDYGTD